jgi:hypothetical protein
LVKYLPPIWIAVPEPLPLNNGMTRLITSRFAVGKRPPSNFNPSKEEEAAKNDVWNGRFQHPANQNATTLIGANAFNIYRLRVIQVYSVSQVPSRKWLRLLTTDRPSGKGIHALPAE